MQDNYTKSRSRVCLEDQRGSLEKFTDDEVQEIDLRPGGASLSEYYHYSISINFVKSIITSIKQRSQ
jgi:hypothetical protein